MGEMTQGMGETTQGQKELPPAVARFFTGAAVSEPVRGLAVVGLGTNPGWIPDEGGAVWWFAWSPDERHLALGRLNGGISIWNLDAMAKFVAQLESRPREFGQR